MSTQIFNAYFYKGTNSLKIKNLNFQLKELIENKIFINLKNTVIKDCVKAIDYLSVNNYKLESINYENLIKQLINMNLFTNLDKEKFPNLNDTDNLTFYKLMYLLKLSKENYKYKIRFIPFGKNTYYKINLPKNLDIDEDLKKLGLYEFDYYDNTDKPENIKTSEWKFREKVWDNIFSNSSLIDNSMYSFYNEDFFIEFEDFKLNELIESINEDSVRLKYIYSKYLYKKFDVMSKLEKNEDGSCKLSNYLYLLDEFHDELEKDILNSIHLNAEYKVYLKNIDEIFKLLNFNNFK